MVRDKLWGQVGYDPYKGLELLPTLIHRWGDPSPLFDFIIRGRQPKIIIEVGTWFGSSALHMAKICKEANVEAEIICVDTFLCSAEHWVKTNVDPGNDYSIQYKNGRPCLYEQFLSNVVRTGHNDIITPFPIDSINGGHILDAHGVKADLIYIDAGHDYLSAFSDILLYKELLTPTGILLIDDAHHEPIQRAVQDAMREKMKYVSTVLGKFFYRDGLRLKSTMTMEGNIARVNIDEEVDDPSLFSYSTLPT